ncbi:hypothetical protein PORY_000559 [Pneumocystis oryctolagi]|uniref:Uncharacterized protein n=1 Tax=Pneumocystis oryctolagi TaxID=42067 RepID=A0ACB7CFI6_9ASCO|nr:hypothetical protein PORY_000559 [Pneumocystis oryctolagi]
MEHPRRDEKVLCSTRSGGIFGLLDPARLCTPVCVPVALETPRDRVESCATACNRVQPPWPPRRRAYTWFLAAKRGRRRRQPRRWRGALRGAGLWCGWVRARRLTGEASVEKRGAKADGSSVYGVAGGAFCMFDDGGGRNAGEYAGAVAVFAAEGSAAGCFRGDGVWGVGAGEYAVRAV